MWVCQIWVNNIRRQTDVVAKKIKNQNQFNDWWNFKRRVWVFSCQFVCLGQNSKNIRSRLPFYIIEKSFQFFQNQQEIWLDFTSSFSSSHTNQHVFKVHIDNSIIFKKYFTFSMSLNYHVFTSMFSNALKKNIYKFEINDISQDYKCHIFQIECFSVFTSCLSLKKVI